MTINAGLDLELSRRSFGDVLGELIVHFSECMTAEEQNKVLEDLSESTSEAYGPAALSLAGILLEFAKRGGER